MRARDRSGRYVSFNDQVRAAAGFATAEPPLPLESAQQTEARAVPPSFDGGIANVVGGGFSASPPSMDDRLRDAWAGKLMGQGGFIA